MGNDVTAYFLFFEKGLLITDLYEVCISEWVMA